MILPLAFGHYRHCTGFGNGREVCSALEQRGRRGGGGGGGGGGGREGDLDRQTKTGRKMRHSSEGNDEDAIPYVVAVFSAQELAYESMTTWPGVLSESLFLLASKRGDVTEVYTCTYMYGELLYVVIKILGIYMYREL